jgi:hypothetical protein
MNLGRIRPYRAKDRGGTRPRPCAGTLGNRDGAIHRTDDARTPARVRPAIPPLAGLPVSTPPSVTRLPRSPRRAVACRLIDALRIGRRPCCRGDRAGDVGSVLGVDERVGGLVIVRIGLALGQTWARTCEEIFRGYASRVAYYLEAVVVAPSLCRVSVLFRAFKKMASRTSHKEWVRDLPWAFGMGRHERKRAHSVSERSVGYGFLIGESVRNHS